jgi:hypothetical protein
MHAVLRTYSGSGAKELFDILEKNKAEVERLMRAIKGFRSYALVRTADEGYSLSVFADEAGTAESVRVARDWVAKNAGHVGAGAPTAKEGTTILHAI